MVPRLMGSKGTLCLQCYDDNDDDDRDDPPYNVLTISCHFLLAML